MQIDVSAKGLPHGGPSPTTQSGDKSGSFAAVLDGFLKVAYQTPAEKARDAVLEKHHLSEGQYEALPPKERAAIDDEIALAVRRVTERNTNVPTASQPFLATLQKLARI